MSVSHFGQLPVSVLTNYLKFELIAQDAGAGKVFYCDHPDYHTLIVNHSGVNFQYTLQKSDTANLALFTANLLPGALQVD